MVNFSKDCSVLFFFESEEGKLITLKYERPQILDDNTLNKEAKKNAEDMIKKKLYGAKELIAIAIARNEAQRKDIMNKVEKGFGN